MPQIARTPKQMGAIIRRARREARLSQSELGARTGLWQETISRIENGQGATKLATLFDILAALQLEIEVTIRQQGSPADIEDIF
jgi:HTH-type transcriptional regulator/antitoxin HipB